MVDPRRAMRGARAARAAWGVALLSLLLLASGCALLRPTPLADAPVPYTLRAAVEPARRALEQDWPHAGPVRFRFEAGRCGVGAMVVMVFEQVVPGEPPTRALALTHDVAAGILFGTWRKQYDVADPDADPGAAGAAGRPRDRLPLTLDGPWVASGSL